MQECGKISIVRETHSAQFAESTGDWYFRYPSKNHVTFEIVLFISPRNGIEIFKKFLMDLRRKQVMFQSSPLRLVKIGINFMSNLAENPIRPQILTLEIIVIW